MGCCHLVFQSTDVEFTGTNPKSFVTFWLFFFLFFRVAKCTELAIVAERLQFPDAERQSMA